MDIPERKSVTKMPFRVMGREWYMPTLRGLYSQPQAARAQRAAYSRERVGMIQATIW